jgi:hypothetical protein
MSLQNLLGISLDRLTPDQVQIAKLVAAAQRNIADAQIAGLSSENQFDTAYKAVMQLAMLALNANGYRTLTSKPGHHQTAIQTLTLTVGLAPEKVRLLDAMRKLRNLSDYSGDLVPDAAVAECLTSAKGLMTHVTDWLAKNKPELV